MADLPEVDYSVPDWLSRAVNHARDIYGVAGDEWHFIVRMSDSPGGSVHHAGWAKTQFYNHNAFLEFSPRLENDYLGLCTVFHEVLHASMGDIDYVSESIINHAMSSKRPILSDTLENSKENFVSRVSRATVRLLYPEAWLSFQKEMENGNI